MDEIKLTLIQTTLFWQDRDANLDHFSKLIERINEPTDIIVLPEMFTTGFSMQPENFAETPTGEAIEWMRQMAKKTNAILCGSMMMKDQGKFFNSLIWMDPDGKYQRYDKKHLFRMGDEQLHYAPGTTRIVIDHKGWKIFPVICYDLRFPIWLRRNAKFDYDLMIVVANWPEKRSMHWKTLLQARAIENQCYVAALNRIGKDGNGMNHTGDSSTINAKGEILFQQADVPFIKTFTFYKKEMDEYRNAFPVMADADEFSIL